MKTTTATDQPAMKPARKSRFRLPQAADKLELRVPPLLLVAITATLMWLVTPFVPHPAQLPFHHLALCSIAFASGVLMALTGMITFRLASTTLNPLKPEQASRLVKHGIFRYTRNPMYVGMLLALAGWALYLSHFLPLVLLPAFVFYMNRFQVEAEERMLEQKFGTDFTSWRDTTRRWL